LKYIHDCVRHYKLDSHIRLQQECTSLRWSDKERLWTASFVDLVNGRKYDRTARYAITALGVLNVPKGLDDLPALRSFRGTIFHTAQWRDVDFRDKKVMVIGNGCSANQVIPWIMNDQKPKSLVHVVRSEQWVAPKGDFEHGTLFRLCVARSQRNVYGN
jgi:cation diffusion facilitator CzcD-associated flavoprotein CzcO